MSISGRVNPLIPDEKSLANAHPRAKSEKVVFIRKNARYLREFEFWCIFGPFQKKMKKVLRTEILSHIRHAFLRLKSKVTGEVTYPPVLALFFGHPRTRKFWSEPGIYASERTISSVLLLVKFWHYALEHAQNGRTGPWKQSKISRSPPGFEAYLNVLILPKIKHMWPPGSYPRAIWLV